MPSRRQKDDDDITRTDWTFQPYMNHNEAVRMTPISVKHNDSTANCMSALTVQIGLVYRRVIVVAK